jgi:FkbM family methyltransferase
MAQDPKTVTKPSRYGPMTTPADDHVIGRALRTYGEWAQLELEFLFEFIKEGSVVLDIGACYGTHSLAFAARVGPSGKVVAFEASPRNFLLLKKNCEGAPGGAIELVQAVVSKEGGAAFSLQDNDENPGASKASPAPAPENDAAATLSRTIDSFGFERVDFIKIDVEGMEADVIGGAVETIRRCAPALFFEVNYIEEGRRTIAALGGLGYRFFGLLSDPFNPDNFFGSTERIFGDGRECGVLAVPEIRCDEADPILRRGKLAPIETADDLALLLMNKPQYVRSDIIRTSAARVLTTPAIVSTFGDPARLRQELAELNHAKAEVEQRCAAFAAEIAARSEEIRHLVEAGEALRRDVAETAARNKALSDEGESLRAALDEQGEARQKLTREIDVLQQLKAAQEQAAAAFEVRLRAMVAEQESLRRERDEARAEALKSHEDGQALERALFSLRAENGGRESEVARLRALTQSRESDLHGLAEWKVALEQQLAEFDKRVTDGQDALAEAQRGREQDAVRIAGLVERLDRARALAARIRKLPFGRFLGGQPEDEETIRLLLSGDDTEN